MRSLLTFAAILFSTSAAFASLDPPRTHVLLERFNDEAKRAVVLPVDLNGLKSGAPVERRTVANPAWPDHFVTVSAFDGTSRWAALEPAKKEGEFAVVVRSLGSSKTSTFGLSLLPSALHFAGDVLYVGAENTVGYADLSAPRLKWVELLRRQMIGRKAYDLFARSGSWLIAIDDVVSPIYADSFRLDDRGHAKHTQGWSLPGVINGYYTHAVLVPSGDRDGFLYTVTPYGIRDGWGQDLAAIPIRGDKIDWPEDMVLNSTRHDRVLEEHVDRITEKSTFLTGGNVYSPWTGLAVLRDRVLIAAGARGLLVLPSNFRNATKAKVVATPGECRDVLVSGDRVFVLVGGKSNVLIEYSSAFKDVARVKLPGSFDRFVE